MTVHSLLNILLLVFLLVFPVLIEANKRHYKGKSKALNQSILKMRKVHPFVGSALVLSGALHGYLKLGGQLRFHTGSVVLLVLILTGIMGFAYKKTKKRAMALVHRSLGILVVLALLWHYFWPWAL